MIRVDVLFWGFVTFQMISEKGFHAQVDHHLFWCLLRYEVQNSKGNTQSSKISTWMFCDHVWSACIHIFHLSGHLGTSSTWALQDSQGVCTGPWWRPTAHGKLRQCSRTDRRSRSARKRRKAPGRRYTYKIRYPKTSADDLKCQISFHLMSRFGE